jgi:hypothetical protein
LTGTIICSKCSRRNAVVPGRETVCAGCKRRIAVLPLPPSTASLSNDGGTRFPRQGGRFDPLPIRTATDAEENAARWLAHLGFEQCRATPPGPDSGVDVRGWGVVAQVKAEAKPVRLDVVQRTYGCAQAEGARAVVFGMSSFTRDASEWADNYGVALFSFDFAGTPRPVNACAQLLEP